MSRQGIYRSPEAGDIAYIAQHMREADRQELAAVLGDVSPADALAMAVMRSTLCWTGIAEDRTPVSMFGVAPVALLGGIGSPWLLGTDRVFESARVLIREGRQYATRMLEQFPHLVNYVDARNVASIRWLARIGFTIHAPQPYGAAGLPFHRFEMRA